MMEWFEKNNYIYVDIINEIFLVYLKNIYMYMYEQYWYLKVKQNNKFL